MSDFITFADIGVTYRGQWPWRGLPVTALEGVNLTVAHGETLGIVGESGSGKSTLGRVLLRLLPPTTGRVTVDGIDPYRLPGPALRAYRRRVQAVFQDSVASFNPRMSLGDAVREGLDIHGLGTPGEREAMVRAMLERVGLKAEYAERYPHALSGGQRQRVNIARALVISPEILIADEPVSALDVSIQAQILDLFETLRAERKLTLIFISHDLSVVRELCDRVVVLKAGRIVEVAPTEQLFKTPRHDYTRLLIDSAPDIDRALAAWVPTAGSRPGGLRSPVVE